MSWVRRHPVRVTLAGPAVQAMAAELAAQDGLDIVCEPYLPDHGAALARLGSMRAVAGLGISDGISTTLLEAMAMGTFPIQADRSCGDEWVTPGETGMLVSPHDTAGLAAAITRALTDDRLVDAAAAANRRVVEARWDAETNGAQVARQYRLLAAAPRHAAAA
jgi:glycosyltransferase involved in cell wall biosynthesis